MQKSFKPNANLLPNAYVAMQDGSRLPVVGVDPSGASRCTCCGQCGVAGSGSILWRQKEEALFTRYLMCAPCTKRFKKSGSVQERFLNMLRREAPAVTPDMVKDLPRLTMGIVETDQGPVESYLLLHSDRVASDETTH
jgi:hypothetical protein